MKNSIVLIAFLGLLSCNMNPNNNEQEASGVSISDNTYNIEGRFLAAKHFGRIGQHQKQANIINELLKRKGLTNEVYFTCLKELGLLNESLEKFDESLAIYTISNEKINNLNHLISLYQKYYINCLIYF